MAASTSYSLVDLLMPRAIHERVSAVQGADVDLPFRRQIDFWWAGFVLGVRLGIHGPMGENPVKFHDGSIFSSDPWRITHLELVALAAEGQVSLESASKVVSIAQSYANAGMEQILEKLLGESRPVLTLMNEIENLSSANDAI